MKEKSSKRKENLHKILSKMHALGLKLDQLVETSQFFKAIKRYHFSFVDIEREARAFQGFDLLCVEQDTYKRVSFEVGKNMNPVGIFPFATSNVYISLDEHKLTRSECIEEKLPTQEFWEKVFPLIKDLNVCLRTLKKPIIEGEYYTTSDLPGNFIAGIGGRYGDKLHCICYIPDALAKYRAIGTFKG